MTDDAASTALAALEARLRLEQEQLAYPDRPWVTVGVGAEAGGEAHGHAAGEAHDGGVPAVVDVLVVGGGQAGLTVAGKLLREGVPRVLVVDAGTAGAEGPWVTWARMPTLRTVKELHGPDLGYPSATFRSWFTARRGERAWEDLTLIPRQEWMAYLRWIRQVFAVPYLNDARVVGLTPDGEDGWAVALEVRDAGAPSPASAPRSTTVRARRVVVSTGIDGAGGPTVPAAVAALPRARWSHSSDAIDLAALAGRRVAVLGVGASAFDNAAAALEAGAREVVQFARRPELPTVNSGRLVESRALYRHFATLDDDVRVAVTRSILSLPMPPPDHSVERCRRHPGYDLRLGSPWLAVAATDDGGVLLSTPAGDERFDHLILGTGFTVDLTRVPWLAGVADDVVLWGERYPLDAGDAVDVALARYPYLDAGLACRGRTPETDRHLRHLHLLGSAALASAGTASSGINALPWGTDRVADAVVRSLLVEEMPRVVAGLEEMVDEVQALAPLPVPPAR
ncbi:hypothetical protein C8046_11430 [Serinibacter arcticus]|uniref:L-lysine N6-monooxygenase MbtG n=1 Tax=Serinibacter arcticus TaxID=1655435 RepID=A0A2U1ZVZ7_9MICO|nr:SidA/IucD/PvdA family monooxygenase [Serinibacter arcticus]PWD51167.1 hypothetical protein C8046_11430 [Serinibacter arcticus]